MIDFIKGKEPWTMNLQERLQAIEALKECGNSLFKTQKFERALKKYTKALYYMDEKPIEDAEARKMSTLKVSCLLNSAARKMAEMGVGNRGDLNRRVAGCSSEIAGDGSGRKTRSPEMGVGEKQDRRRWEWEKNKIAGGKSIWVLGGGCFGKFIFLGNNIYLI
ncbi:hypothetical protein ZOSMA_23G00100 [Zostera marina]|uniref:Uncharacterized protein n=1 Tax=Zostera marina TaxID=29655 RepID=A0A0K9PJE0_ZOSMR|nr:hypothetical protein ZOSMA_23G00100 [Zostera marina]